MSGTEETKPTDATSIEMEEKTKKSSSSNTGKNETESNNVNDFFKSSSNQFLFCTEIQDSDGNKVRDINLLDRIVGVIIIILQISSYIYMFIQTLANIKDDTVGVEIKHGICQSNSGNINTFNELSCTPGEENIGVPFLALIVLSFFVLPDISEAVKLFKCNGLLPKISCIIIIIEAIIAMITGGTVAALGNVQSGLESFLGCVGVVFIHDIDEKIKEFYFQFPGFGWLILFIVLTIIPGIIGIVLPTANR